MVTKLGYLNGWNVVNPGDGILMPGVKRRIRIAFNTPKATPVVALTGAGSVLLGTVTGFEEFEFGVDGDCEIHLDCTLPCYWRSDDGQLTASQPSTDSFVKMMERRERNPEMEYMMYMAEQNAARRTEQMMASAEAAIQRMVANGQVSDGAAAGAAGASAPQQSATGGAAKGGAARSGAGGGAAGPDGASEPAGSAVVDAGPGVSPVAETPSAAASGK